MKRLLTLSLASAILAMASLASAQHSSDFMAGRIYQIALQGAPGFTPVAPPSFGTLSEGESQHFEQTLSAGSCTTWIAVSDGQGSDPDLSVSLDGVEVAGDNAPDDWPIAQYCSAQSVDAVVSLSMAGGRGGYGLQTWSRSYGVSDQVELQLDFLASYFIPEDVPQGPVTRGSLTAGREQTYPLPLSGGSCYTIIGTGARGVANLDLYLLDASGQMVAADEAFDNAPIVGACPEANENFTVRVRMTEGIGDFGWRVFRASN